MNTASRLKTSPIQVRIMSVYLTLMFHLLTSLRSRVAEVILLPVAGFVF